MFPRPDTSPPRRNPSTLPALLAAPRLSRVTSHESRVTKSSRINTCKSLSKQRTLTTCRMIDLQKTWRGVLWLTGYPIRIAVLSDHREPKDLSSIRHPSVPLQPATLGATMPSGARILCHPGETTPLYPVSKRSERTSVTATARRRPGLQVVPGSTVLTVDRSRVARTSIQVIVAEKDRVGKAGSVRLG